MIIARKIHFVGIGGIGMSALAHILLERGLCVSGSDMRSSAVTDALAAGGAKISLGHDVANVGRSDLVVVTSAARQDNVEIAEAKRRGIRIIKRAELLGDLMSERRGIAVAGTHGKTTTTWMIAHILQTVGLDPGYAVGGELPTGERHGHNGSGELFAAEADEYDGSFLQLKPEFAVVTNIEADHLDFYRDLDHITSTFCRFLDGVRPGGSIILNSDNQVVAGIAASLQSHAKKQVSVSTYGIESDAHWQARNMNSSENGSAFDVFLNGQEVGVVSLPVPGAHNVSNALGAIALCSAVGVYVQDACSALSSFQSVKRRFEIKGEVDGITVVDDYAHHPSEIEATLRAARQRFPGRRIWAVFQPHTFSRTKSLLHEFATSLTPADSVIIAGIYAARETDDLGVSGEDIARLIGKPQAAYIEDVVSIPGYLDRHMTAGDVLITIGAGDIWKAGEEFLRVRCQG